MSKSDEWYTQAKYIDAAHAAMGCIDLDPASCEEANQIVKAKRYFTIEHNGLSRLWTGCVWLNCPFSQQKQWAKKAQEEFKAGHMEQCIFLCQAATERQWFQSLWQFPICFANHQVLFNRPGSSPYHIYHGVCFVYIGHSTHIFVREFSQFGQIVR